MDPVTQTSFSIFPNPSQNSITVNSNRSIELSIVNLLGEIVLAKTVKDKEVIDISFLSSGIYYIRAKEGGVLKLVKQ
jgi:hypothetical protein